MKIEESRFITPPPADPRVAAAIQRFGIVGTSPALLAAVERAVKVAPIDLSVLVTGESGSGKEFFPRIIHQGSPRRHARYIAVNCGAIPEGTIDSELFGHEKGSFTGAIATRKGYFEEADGGTIFLDEVAELPLTTQARLLRVLETGEFIKVGSSTVQTTDIRIVAATNVNLLQAVANKKFREDLYYRLSTVHIDVPPLRDRGNDIELLARKFAADFAERYNTPRATLDDTARRLMHTYRWPGNVRELKNAVEQISLFESGSTVDADTLRAYLTDMDGAARTMSGAATASDIPPHLATTHHYDREREMLFNLIFSLRGRVDELSRRLDAMTGVHPAGADTAAPQPDRLLPACNCAPTPQTVPPRDAEPRDTTDERTAIIAALERYDGRRRDAARALDISERTLYRKIKEYGIE